MAYIDTKYLGKCETCRRCRSGGCNAFCDCGEEYSPDMSKIPTADVAEVKHGKWVQDKYLTQKCSFCGFEIDDDVSFEMYGDCYRKPKYCPECGAKMECET